MPAMMDATCPKCGNRVGWSGAVTDRPPCPRCGHQPPREQLELEERVYARVERLLATHPRDATPADLAAMRKLAGLTVGRAAKKLRAPLSLIRVVEGGWRPLHRVLADRMAEVYGCGD